MSPDTEALAGSQVPGGCGDKGPITNFTGQLSNAEEEEEEEEEEEKELYSLK